MDFKPIPYKKREKKPADVAEAQPVAPPEEPPKNPDYPNLNMGRATKRKEGTPDDMRFKKNREAAGLSQEGYGHPRIHPIPDPNRPAKYRGRTGPLGRVQFSPEVCKAILDAVRAGNPLGNAVKLVGINRSTFLRWRDSDPELQAQYEQAEAESVNSNIGIIKLAAKKQWQAAAWLLERQFPQDWALRQVVALEDNLISDMEKRLNAGRERAAAAGAIEEIQSGSGGSGSKLLQ